MAERRFSERNWRWYRLPCGDCGATSPTAARQDDVPDRCPACRNGELSESWRRLPRRRPVVLGESRETDGRCVYVAPRARDMTWMDRANCLGCDPELFFPERGESTIEAKAVCAGCAVRVECLGFALAVGEK